MKRLVIFLLATAVLLLAGCKLDLDLTNYHPAPLAGPVDLKYSPGQGRIEMTTHLVSQPYEILIERSILAYAAKPAGNGRAWSWTIETFKGKEVENRLVFTLNTSLRGRIEQGSVKILPNGTDPAPEMNDFRVRFMSAAFHEVFPELTAQEVRDGMTAARAGFIAQGMSQRVDNLSMVMQGQANVDGIDCYVLKFAAAMPPFKKKNRDMVHDEVETVMVMDIKSLLPPRSESRVMEYLDKTGKFNVEYFYTRRAMQPGE